jgi:hypothetical protein
MKVIDDFLFQGVNLYKIHIVLLMIIFVLLIVVMTLSTTITPKVKYIEFGKEVDYSFSVLPRNIDKSQKELLTRQILRDFVLYIEKYSTPTDVDSIAKKKVLSMASAYVISEYRRRYINLYNQKIDKTIDIQTQILNDKIIIPQKIHQIRFKRKEETLDKIIHKEFIANIQYDYSSEKTVLNPLGIKIIKYTATEKLEK